MGGQASDHRKDGSPLKLLKTQVFRTLCWSNKTGLQTEFRLSPRTYLALPPAQRLDFSIPGFTVLGSFQMKCVRAPNISTRGRVSVCLLNSQQKAKASLNIGYKHQQIYQAGCGLREASRSRLAKARAPAVCLQTPSS